MARPRSDKKREAITLAAVHVIASHGLSAATATIAKEAGVSNGSLFTYFETKADLLNQVYVELKAEMAGAALTGLRAEDGLREQMLYMWLHWLQWATACPQKRRALAHLEVSDEITPASRKAARQAMSGIARLLERICENGPMCEAPPGLVVSLMSALADATVDFMIRDPVNADQHSRSTFDALWRMIA